jgi:hypothetical protein
VVLLQVVIIIPCQCSNFFNGRSVVCKITRMTSAVRAQVVVEEGGGEGRGRGRWQRERQQSRPCWLQLEWRRQRAQCRRRTTWRSTRRTTMYTSLRLPPPPLPMACPAPPHLLTNIVAPSLMGLVNVVVVLSWLWLPLTSVCQGRMQRRKGCRGCHPTSRHYLVFPGVIAMMKTPPHTRDSTAYCH